MGWLDRLMGKKARITVTLNKELVTAFDLDEEQILIGRTTETIPQPVLKVPGRVMIINRQDTMMISREHATLIWDQAIRKYRFKDTSKTGTGLDGESIRRNPEGEIIKNGSNIFIAPFMFQLFYK